MRRAIPLVVLALVGLVAFAAAPSAKPMANQRGSLSMDASLDRSQLLANQRGEAFLRVAVTGVPVQAAGRLPMNVVVVIDRSGSMGSQSPSGTQKMADARAAAKFLVAQLAAGDKIAIVSFDDQVDVLAETCAIGDSNCSRVNAAIDTLYPRGNTNMHGGLSTALSQAKALFRRDQVNRIILISDGQPNTPANLNTPEQLTTLTRSIAAAGINVTTIGVGTDYNEDLMSKVADAGQGNYYFVADTAKMATIFDKELKTMMAVVGREAVVKIALRNGVRVEQVYGYEASIGRDEAAIPVGDVMGGRYQEVLTRLSFPAQSGQRELVDVTLVYHDALAKVDRKLNSTVAAQFVTDERQVAASLNKEVAEKVEKVKIAGAMQQAMDEFKAGRADNARQILRTQNAASKTANSIIGSESLTGDLKSLDDIELSVDEGASAETQSTVQKKNKAAARMMMH